MLSQLTYINKCYAIILIFVGFIVLGYKLSFADTFVLISELSQKKTELETLQHQEKEIPEMKSALEELNKFNNTNDTVSPRDKLTHFISNFSENNSCIVTEIPNQSIYKDKDLIIETNVFIIKGNFHNLIKLLNELEIKFRHIAKIMSGKFYISRDLTNKKTNLYLNVVAQSFNQKAAQ